MEMPKMSRSEMRRREKMMRLFEMMLHEDTVRTIIACEGKEKASEDLCRMYQKTKRRQKRQCTI